MPRSLYIWIRRLVQLFFVYLILSTPLSQVVRTFRQDPQPYMESPLIRNNDIREYLFENDISLKKKWSVIYDDISGGAYSLKLYGLKVTEPLTSFLLIIRNSYNLNFWNWTVVISISIALLFALLFGRIFCSFICPWSMIANLSLKLHFFLFKKYPKFSASLDNKFVPKWQKYYILILSVLLLFNPIFLQYILPPAIIQNGWSDYILYGDIALWLILFFGLLIVEFIKPTFFCRMLCPTGIFLSWVGRIRVFQLSYAKKTKCELNCVQCIDKCWLGLDPKVHANDSACDLCARCINVCPTSRLTIKRKKKYKFSPIVILFALMFVGCNSDKKIIDFGDSQIDISVLEHRNEQLMANGDTLNISYSVYVNEFAQVNGGVANFDLHLNTNDKEIIVSPILITVTKVKNDSFLVDELIPRPNHPISILVRSTYHVKFNFERNTRYIIKAKSPSGLFEPLIIDFEYPKKRI